MEALVLYWSFGISHYSTLHEQNIAYVSHGTMSAAVPSNIAPI